MQSIMLAYNLDGYTASAAPTGELSGPVDDAMIITAADGTPQDPYCCKGPHILDDGVHTILLTRLSLSMCLSDDLHCLMTHHEVLC